MFKVAQFDRNNEADSVCKELFKQRNHPPKKETKIKKGKITKKNAKKKNEFKNNGKIKDEIRNILNNSSELVQTKVKIKKTKSHQPQHPNIINKTKTTAPFITQNNNESNNTYVKKQKRRKNQKQQKTENGFASTNPFQNGNPMTPKQKRKKKQQKRETDAPSANPLKNEDAIISKQNNKKKQKGENNSARVEIPMTLKQRKQEQLKQKILHSLQTPSTQNEKRQKPRNLSLRERMMQRLQAARFRYINEQIYSNDSKEAQKIFKEDPDAFTAYHEGYRQQVSKWPLNPLDVIIRSIQQLPKTSVIADFGCGDAKLAKSVTQKVHSFDLVAANDDVVACDMAHVPLEACSVDGAVFCLSLMGTNLHDYLLEANRVLKPGGVLKIAEVESRFDDVKEFIAAVQRFHFKNTWQDLSHNLFYFLDFKKESNIKNKKKLPRISLNPCLYKKR